MEKTYKKNFTKQFIKNEFIRRFKKATFKFWLNHDLHNS